MDIAHALVTAVLVVANAAGSGGSAPEGDGGGLGTVPPPVHTGPGGNSLVYTGTVKWWSSERGFGFITPDIGDKDLFVHHSGIVPDTLADCDAVTFEISHTAAATAVNVDCVW